MTEPRLRRATAAAALALIAALALAAASAQAATAPPSLRVSGNRLVDGSGAAYVTGVVASNLIGRLKAATPSELPRIRGYGRRHPMSAVS